MAENGKLLHGTLEVTIFRATSYKPSAAFRCIPTRGKSAYVNIKIDNEKVAKTTHEKDRVWNQTFQILCAHPLDTKITITLKKKRSVLGRIDIEAGKLMGDSSLINGFFPLTKTNGKPTKTLKLQLIIWFKPADCEKSWDRALEIDGGYRGLKNSSFPMRSNCGVTLYQDAHHCSTFRPPFDLCGTPRKLWEDVYNAIDGAKHLVYIAGWSFNPQMALVRDPQTDIPHARGVKLGELLKRKADEGVSVRILLWDDETSLPIIKNKGVMKTHDEDALSYFKHTKVICRLCPRLHDKFPTVFTHHQKTITADARAGPTSRAREIVSFVGGLDLCDGRYDTDDHSLFRTLNTESHCYDFYQTSLQGASLHKGGPREPWHDTHACLTGRAARDILENFEQRWTKQCGGTSLLLPVSSIQELSESRTGEGRNWNVQVFRSIDHVSATPLPKNLRVEKSIHEAYVDAIRRADRFIYVENQYFIGGCHLWEENKHSGCRNLIPIEIALKIARKIKVKERFAAYVVIPMWPEGPPESESVRDILHWTRETVKMMYGIIGEALRESGEEGHPRDYLNLFCLGNRETEVKGEFVPPYHPHQGTDYWNAQVHRRFMVYVHSKLMIVDDTYLLIGSANVNQRSMDGQRDTEIAIGCYQTRKNDNETDHKDIREFRMSLWYEHTGRAQEVYKEPQSLECVHKIRAIGDEMWKIYSRDEVEDMGGVHLVTYPVNVTETGCVEDLVEGDGCFPDTKTPIKGKRSKVLLAILTT